MVVQSKSSSTGSNNEQDRGDNSCYYPGCKKNANCKCEICIDSINATLDLMPITTLTKLSASKPIHHNHNLDCTPISFDPSLLSTPTSTASLITPLFTPLIKSRPTSHFLNHNIEIQNKGKQGSLFGIKFLWLVLGLGFLLSADVVFPWAASGILKPALSADLVKRVAEKCLQVSDLNAKLRFLQNDLTSIVNGKVSNCSYSDSTWEITQDGLLLNSRCTLYKSAIEEITIWGWPLQTAGLLTNGLSFRSFTILSGRLTQWNDGQVGYLIRKANTSWDQPKLGASAVQLDPNTWILEYQRSSIFNGTRLHKSALEFLKYRISRIIGRVNTRIWLLAAFEDNHFKRFKSNNGIQIPT